MRRVHAELGSRPTGRGRSVTLPPDPVATTVVLPPARPLPPVTVEQALLRRRSAYTWGPGQMALPDLADLLRWSLGVQREVLLPDGRRHRAGVAPSAGGLPSLEPWLVVRGPGALSPGVHRADVRHADGGGGGTLTRTRAGDPTDALTAVLDQPPFATRSTVVVVLVARLDLTLPTYGPRHYRTLHLDAGIALQNLQLVATALDLPGCPVSGFSDEGLAALLALPQTAFPAALFVSGSRVQTSR